MNYNESFNYNLRELKEYKELGIEKYIFLAALDSRTCPVCGNLDGRIFSINEAKIGANFPPLHKDCRCTTVAYMGKEWYENLTRRARDPETGKSYVIPCIINYSNWIINNNRLTLKNKEIECINIINNILCKSITYYALGNNLFILLSNSPYSWLCRITINSRKHNLVLRRFGDYETDYNFQEPKQLYIISNLITYVANLCNEL